MFPGDNFQAICQHLYGPQTICAVPLYYSLMTIFPFSPNLHILAYWQRETDTNCEIYLSKSTQFLAYDLSSAKNTNFSVQAITARKDRNNYYEAIKAHGAVVTCSLFAPVPNLLLEAVARGKEHGEGRNYQFRLIKENKYLTPGAGKDLTGEVVVSGDFEGDIKVFINRRNI